mgnify:FL=1
MAKGGAYDRMLGGDGVDGRDEKARDDDQRPVVAVEAPMLAVEGGAHDARAPEEAVAPHMLVGDRLPEGEELIALAKHRLCLRPRQKGGVLRVWGRRVRR